MRAFVIGLFLLLGSPLSPLRADFLWVDTPGKFLELTRDDKAVARYVYEAIDTSTPARREETFKPCCHLYFYQWKQYGNLLTKGPGGDFTHHRGVFYGFNAISYVDQNGKMQEHVDTWHCRKAYQVHRRFTDQRASATEASFTAEIDWIGNDGVAFAKESRTMRFSYRDPDMIVDFHSSLAPLVTELHLDGDPQHAGFQFRAHSDVGEKNANATYFIRPETGIARPGTTINWSPKNDSSQTRDLLWKAMCFTLNDTQVTVSYLDRPDNPKPARASERSYGRFGTYFATTVKNGDPLVIRYRLVIHPGEYTSPDEVAKLSTDYLAESKKSGEPAPK